MSIFETLQGWGGEAAETVKSWSWMEDEEKPRNAVQQATSQKLAEGSALPQIANAQTNTGATVSETGYAVAIDKTTLMIGGGVAAVVLLVLVIMLRGR